MTDASMTSEKTSAPPPGTPPSGGKESTFTRPEWIFLIALACIAGLAELAIVIINFSTMPIYLKNGLKLPNLAGLSLSVFLLAEALGNSPMGALSDRFGRRPMILAGATISVVTCLLTVALRVPETEAGVLLLTVGLLTLRVLDGMGAAMYWPAIFASIGDRLPPERQAQGMSILNVTYLVGIAFGPFIGGLLNDNFGQRYNEYQPERYAPSFFVAALCFGLIGILAAIFTPRKAKHAIQPEESAPELAAVSAADSAHGGAPMVAIKRAFREVPLVLLMGFLIFFGTAGLLSPSLKTYVMERLAISESIFGSLMLYPAVIIAGLSFPLAKTCDRWGKSRSIKLGLGIVAAALWGLLFIHQPWTVVAIGVLLGIGFLLSFPSYMAYVSELGGSERAGMIGAVRMAQGIGALLGAAFSSTLYALDPQHHAIFICASSVVTVGWILSLFVIRPLPSCSINSKNGAAA